MKNKSKTNKHVSINDEQISEIISSINRELMCLKIDVERELEIHVMNKYNLELRSQNLLN